MLNFLGFDKPFKVHAKVNDFDTSEVLMQNEWPLQIRAKSLMVDKRDGQLMVKNSLS
jgi:hypothetical protein